MVASVVLVGPEDRKRAHVSFWLLVCHLVCVLIPRHSPAETSVRLLALSFVLASIARSTFLLFVHSFLIRKVARPLPKILRDVIQGFMFAVAFLLVLHSAGIEPGSLLATSALLTAVIGLSLQDTLGNLFAGLAIQAQRPFAVGDWVQFDSQDGQIGRVIEINWRATRVLTLERLEITVPNGVVAKSSIVNFSRPTHLVRREAEVHAPYEVSPEHVRKVLLSGMDHVHEVMREPRPQVFTRGFTERGVNYMVRYFIAHFEQREVIDSMVRERLWYAMHRAQLMIPVPRRHVEIIQQSDVQQTETDKSTAAAQLLKQVSLFKLLPEDSTDYLAGHCRRRRYAPEEVIVHEGDSSTEMYIVENGRVRIELCNDDGRTLVIADLQRGEFFGEMSLMTGELRSADVIASEETTVLMLDREALVPLMEKYPELAEHMSQALVERQMRLDELRHVDVEVRRDSRHDELEILKRIRRFFAG